ncbi:MAG: MauE/DoxX family redox-associated membrane protein [Chthoniobacterales bacterium]
MNIAILLARGLLAAVFFYSGVIKLGSSESFAATIYSFAIVPEWFANIFAHGLPWAELLAAILLVFPRVYRAGALLISIFCVLFLIALGWALSYGLVIDCNCFGESAPSLQKMWFAMARDVFLFAVAIFILFARKKGNRP